MFKNSKPNINEITIVVPTSIEATHVNVQLIQYVDLHGIILLSELIKGKLKNVRKVAKIGASFPAIVTNIDEKNNITLSKRNISETQIKQCVANFQKMISVTKIVDTTVNILQNKHEITIDKNIIYDNFINVLIEPVEITEPDVSIPDKILEKLRLANENFDKVYPNLKLSDCMIIDCFKSVLQRKFKIPDLLVETVLEITCYEDNGVLIIKDNLVKLSKKSTDKVPFAVKILKSPHYSISVKTDDPKTAIEFISSLVSELKNDLETKGANFKIIKDVSETFHKDVLDDTDNSNKEEFFSDDD